MTLWAIGFGLGGLLAMGLIGLADEIDRWRRRPRNLSSANDVR